MHYFTKVYIWSELGTLQKTDNMYHEIWSFQALIQIMVGLLICSIGTYSAFTVTWL